MVSARTLRLAGLHQLAATALVSVVALAAYPDALSGVLLGGMVMAVNLGLMRYLMGKMLNSPQRRAAYALGLGLKFVVLLALITCIMTFLQPDLVGFAAGLSTFFAGVGGALVQTIWAGEPPVPHNA
ncbi:MAG TPA: ATP synthase subunit I [Myxococcota bacterium]|nr:ATP synthase subunit I [Myxococcota bacterium]